MNRILWALAALVFAAAVQAAPLMPAFDNSLPAGVGNRSVRAGVLYGCWSLPGPL